MFGMVLKYIDLVTLAPLQAKARPNLTIVTPVDLKLLDLVMRPMYCMALNI